MAINGIVVNRNDILNLILEKLDVALKLPEGNSKERLTKQVTIDVLRDLIDDGIYDLEPVEIPKAGRTEFVTAFA